MLLALKDASYRVIPFLLRAVGSPNPDLSREGAGALIANWRSLHGQEDLLKRLERSRRMHVRQNLSALGRLIPTPDS